MATYVTPQGYVSQTFEINKAAWETIFQAAFGDNIDLDPEGPFGQFIALAAKRDTDVFDGIQEAYTSRDVDQAVGVFLDILFAERGLIRIGQTATFVGNVILYGTVGTLIEAGKQAKQSTGINSSVLFGLVGDVTISLGAARVITLLVQEPTIDLEDFTITIDGAPYMYNPPVPPEDENDVAAGLVALITAGSFEGSVSAVDNAVFISQESLDFSISYTANILLDTIGSAGSFQALTLGVIPIPINTLDEIVTPVVGWDEVINPTAGDTGREVETDSEFRIRGAQTGTASGATEQAIVNGVSNEVEGVTRAVIQSNRTDFVDGDGLDPHSFEVVVSGGLDQDIADKIWQKQGGGIASQGNISVIVVDSEGRNQTVYFSRPTPLYAWVKVKRSLFSEEDYPSDGDVQIKQSIVDYADINIPIGLDVIRQRLATPVYKIPGIEDIEITIDDTASPGGTPIYAATNIPVAIREVAEFDISRIIVEDL